MKHIYRLTLFCILVLLTGCKSELYSKLDEGEANQMMALLIYNKIPAEKTVSKEGIALEVDKDRFVDAVEVLRQNGLPRRKPVDIQELFPSGQLVSSPEQEQAKLSYFKSQQLAAMLNGMDGVINADVSVAEKYTDDVNDPPPSSASVYIKYSPDVNLPAREAEIRALILNGIPGLTPERITLTMQRAQYRYQPQTDATPQHGELNKLPAVEVFNHKFPGQILAALAGIVLLGVLIALILFLSRRFRKVV